VVLFDGHSIKSVLPWLFEGRLPDLNLGTAAGASCAPSLRAALTRVLDAQAFYTHVVDGRFKGGHITRHYGQPHEQVHALQIELAQSGYMDEAGTIYESARAEPLRALLRDIVGALLRWRPATA
jgi:N-formylglutamate deformylase